METTLENVRLLRQGQILKEWRPEVNDDFWSDEAQQEVKRLMKSFLEDTLEQDLELQRERATGSLYRNGYYPRSLHTQFGLMQDLQVPI